MNKKLVIIFEILFVVIAITYYAIFELIPEYKSQFGSSDKIINEKRFQNMIEFNIDDKADFALVLDKEKTIYHIMFFDKGSTTLYNKDIENHSINFVIDKIAELLITNNILTSTSNIELTRYTDKYYEEVLTELKNIASKYSLNLNIIEKTNTIADLAVSLGISSNSDTGTISYIDYYSKEIIRKYKDSTKEYVILNEDSSKTFSNNIYKKIEEYLINNDISNLEKDNTLLVIETIPADSNMTYYPTSNSWYYVSDNKIYAYIEFVNGTTKYGYCYNGSIDLRKNGECDK